MLCFSLVEPILRTLDAKHTYAKSLVMGAPLLRECLRVHLGGKPLFAALGNGCGACQIISICAMESWDLPDPCTSCPAGIALASNLGGMTSPISSPQNLFAIERMSLDGNAPSWGVWFAVALPVVSKDYSLVCCSACTVRAVARHWHSELLHRAIH